MKTLLLTCLFLIFFQIPITVHSQERPRDLGIEIGVLPTGLLNAITDVEGVRVGHLTKIEGTHIRTGVTAILPHHQNIFQQKVPAGIFVGNGFGKLAGSTQVEELGNLESPIVLTNTLSVAQGIEGVIDYTLTFPENQLLLSVNAVVGETNDGYLNDIQGRHINAKDVLKAIQEAKSGPVTEGNVGAGTGTVCFGFKGGIGTSSRKLPEDLGGFTLGVLVQTNFGGVLEINGVKVGKALGKYAFKEQLESADGSCMIVVATDAPISSRNLKRLAQRAFMGLAKTGGIASNGSGDYVIAFSTHPDVMIPHQAAKLERIHQKELRNEDMGALFLAAIEATEEAIINSLFAAGDMTGHQDHAIKALPLDKVLPFFRLQQP